MRWKLAHPWWGSNSRSLDYIPSSNTCHIWDHQSKASQIYFHTSGSPNKEIVYENDKKYGLNMSDDGHFEFSDLWENGVIYSLAYGRNGFSTNFHIKTTNEVLFLKNAYRSLFRAIFQFFVLTIPNVSAGIGARVYELPSQRKDNVVFTLRAVSFWCFTFTVSFYTEQSSLWHCWDMFKLSMWLPL